MSLLHINYCMTCAEGLDFSAFHSKSVCFCLTHPLFPLPLSLSFPASCTLFPLPFSLSLPPVPCSLSPSLSLPVSSAGLWVLPSLPGRWTILLLPGATEDHFLHLPSVCQQRGRNQLSLRSRHLHHPPRLPRHTSHLHIHTLLLHSFTTSTTHLPPPSHHIHIYISEGSVSILTVYGQFSHSNS